VPYTFWRNIAEGAPNFVAPSRETWATVLEMSYDPKGRERDQISLSLKSGDIHHLPIPSFGPRLEVTIMF
jgi:hypothetical protein